MSQYHTWFSIALAAISTVTCEVSALQVFIDTNVGENIVLDVKPNESFESVIDAIQYHMDTSDNKGHSNDWTYSKPADSHMELYLAQSSVVAKAARNTNNRTPPRDYNIPLNPQERKDVGYIVRYLSKNNLIKIGLNKSSIKAAGDRVEHLHPLRFLEIIFTDEELKAHVRNLQGKSWVWSDFLGGITGSLTKEDAVNNVRSEYVQDFANRVKIDYNIVYNNILLKKWEKLVDDLIQYVPRDGDSNRYLQ